MATLSWILKRAFGRQERQVNMVRSTNNCLNESLKEITWLHYQLIGPTPLFSFKSENQTMHNGNLEIRILTFLEKKVNEFCPGPNLRKIAKPCTCRDGKLIADMRLRPPFYDGPGVATKVGANF